MAGADLDLANSDIVGEHTSLFIRQTAKMQEQVMVFGAIGALSTIGLTCLDDQKSGDIPGRPSLCSAVGVDAPESSANMPTVGRKRRGECPLSATPSCYRLT
jgi:hypothetical protein